MSRRALALGIRDWLRTSVVGGGLALPVKECGLTAPGGKPPASMGDRYVGIWVGARSTGRVHHGLKEVYTAYVTITFRKNGQIPDDRIGDLLMAGEANPIFAPGGGGRTVYYFDDYVDSIRASINQDYYTNCIMNLANAYLDPESMTTTNPTKHFFNRGLEFMGDEDPRMVGPEWFSSEGRKDCGIVQTQRYGGAIRVQGAVSGLQNVT